MKSLKFLTFILMGIAPTIYTAEQLIPSLTAEFSKIANNTQYDLKIMFKHPIFHSYEQLAEIKKGEVANNIPLKLINFPMGNEEGKVKSIYEIRDTKNDTKGSIIVDFFQQHVPRIFKLKVDLRRKFADFGQEVTSWTNENLDLTNTKEIDAAIYINLKGDKWLREEIKDSEIDLVLTSN